MITIWMTYFVAAMAASGVFILAGWRGRHARTSAARQSAAELPTDPLWGEDELELVAAATQADVAAAIRLALKRLAPVIAGQFVKVEIAAPAGLLVRMRGPALADLLEELLAVAIHSAPACRLLLTAGTYGDRVYVGITDDRPGADPAFRASSVRGLMQRVAMRGGSLEIDVRPAEGTTITLRLTGATADAPEDATVQIEAVQQSARVDDQFATGVV